MKIAKRTKLTISTFGTILGIAGLEHGVGEILQGNINPGTFFILSWPNNVLYEVLAGEPAFTIIPNMRITGITAIIVSLMMIIWSIGFIEKKYGATGIILISLLMFLFGAGFAGPILIGVVLGLAAIRMNSKVQKKQKSILFQKFTSRLWIVSYLISLFSWLTLWPGIIIYTYFLGEFPETAFIYFILMSFISLILAVFSGLARDRTNQSRFIEEKEKD